MIVFLADKLRLWLTHRRLPWHLALLAMLLCAPALWVGWQTDDHAHRATLMGLDEFPDLARSPAELFAFIKSDPESNRRAIDLGHRPWWSNDDLRLAFYRPISGFSQWIDYQLWPQRPTLMHLHSLIWFGAAVAAAAVLFRRMIGPPCVAGLAALLFALDDAHGFPAVWIANRNTSIAVLFGLLSLTAYDRWRRDHWRPGALLAPLAFFAGLLSKESAVAIAAYLVAYALFIDRGTPVRRFGSVLPCAIVGLLWWTAYKTMGYGAVGSAVYIDPGLSPVRFAKAVLDRGPILLVGQWGIPSDLRLLMSQRAARVSWWAAIAFLALVVTVLIPLLRRDRVARFWAVGMLFAVLPACSTFVSDRMLFFVGIGGMGLLARFIAGVKRKEDWLPTRAVPAWSARVLCVVFVLINLVLSPLSLTQRAGDLKAFGDVFERAAVSLPSDAAVRDQEVFIVNTPSAFVPMFAPLIQALNGKAIPQRTMVLGSGIHVTEVHRPDAMTLVIRPEFGFLAPRGIPRQGMEDEYADFNDHYLWPPFDTLYCDGRPNTNGRRIELTGLTIEISAVTNDGRPAEATFEFDSPLEDPSRRWLRWKDGLYVPFEVPAVGETVTLRPVIVPFQMTWNR